MSSKLPIGVATTYKHPMSNAASHIHFNNRLRAVVVALSATAIVAISGCQSQDPAGTPPAAPVPAPEPVAATSGQADLNAAETLLRAGDASAADAIAERLSSQAEAGDLPPTAEFDLHLLEVRIALALNDLAQAEDALRRARPGDAAQRARHTRLAAQFDVAAGRPGAGAARLATIDAAAVTDPTTLVATLWDYARRARADTAADADDVPGTAADAWRALLADYQEALTPRQQERVWAQWRAAHPRHIAALAPPPFLSDAAMPRRIALMLPLSGTLAPAARAVRDGFVAAYFASAPPSWQSIRLYDTAAASVAALYGQAVTDDAALVVGPLAKEATRELWALNPDLPVLALNTVPATPAPAPAAAPRIQFALAAVADGRALGRRLSADGARRIALFRGGEWSESAAAELQAHLGADAQVVATSVLRDVKGVTANVAETLGVAASQQRHQQLARHFGGTVHFTARRRQDVDAVAALVEADYLASLRPALAFHFAADVPIYASSQALRDGGEGPGLDGARVCGMPWQLHPPRSKAALQGAFEQVGGAMEALFAFGVDAFRIANRLDDFNGGRPLRGGTGWLTLGNDGVVQRELVWAEVRNGRFRALP